MSVQLAASALIDLDEFKEYTGITGTDDTVDDTITRHINACSQSIYRYIGRQLCPISQVVEVFDGTGEKSYYAKNWPIAAVSLSAPTPVLKYWNGTSWTTHSGTFTWASVSGRFYFTDGNIFTKGEDNWQLTYYYGYARADVPSDIKSACVQWVFRMRAKLTDGKEGLNSQAFDNATTSYDLNRIPADLKHTFDLVRGKIYG